LHLDARAGDRRGRRRDDW